MNSWISTELCELSRSNVTVLWQLPQKWKTQKVHLWKEFRFFLTSSYSCFASAPCWSFLPFSTIMSGSSTAQSSGIQGGDDIIMWLLASPWGGGRSGFTSGSGCCHFLQRKRKGWQPYHEAAETQRGGGSFATWPSHGIFGCSEPAYLTELLL